MSVVPTEGLSFEFNSLLYVLGDNGGNDKYTNSTVELL